MNENTSNATLAKMEYGDMTAWEHDSRLSLSGTTDTAMPFFLNQHTAVKEIVFCLDKDHAGQEASYALAKKYADKGYSVMIDSPIKKDFNEELKVFQELISEAQRRSKSSHRDVDIYQ